MIITIRFSSIFLETILFHADNTQIYDIEIVYALKSRERARGGAAEWERETNKWNEQREYKAMVGINAYANEHERMNMKLLLMLRGVPVCLCCNVTANQYLLNLDIMNMAMATQPKKAKNIEKGKKQTNNNSTHSRTLNKCKIKWIRQQHKIKDEKKRRT